MRTPTNQGHIPKLAVRWTGPYRVVEISSASHVFMIEHLLSKARFEAHASRLKFYADSAMDIDDVLIDSIETQDASAFTPERILGHHYDPKRAIFEFNIQWRGFNSEENSWEPFQTIYGSSPELVESYIATLSAVQRKPFTELISQYS